MDKIQQLRKQASLLRLHAQNARNSTAKQQYAHDAEHAEQLAAEIQREQDRREEIAHGPYLGGTPTGNPS
jgi:hypothetical protein